MRITIILAISIIAVLFAGTSNHLISNVEAQEETSTSKFIVLSSYTEKSLVEQRVTIKGNFFNTANQPVEETIELIVFDLSNSINAKEIYSNVVYAKDGKFQDNGFIPPKTGLYKIIAKASPEIRTTTTIRAVDYFEAPSILALLGSLLSGIALLTITAFINNPRIKLVTYRVLRFALTAIIAFGMVAFFFLIDVELGTQSPIGIVIKEHIITPNTQESVADENFFDSTLKLQWIMHIGGHSEDNYSSGLEIPLFIIIGGAFGGYIRILHHAKRSWVKEKLMLQLEDPVKPDDRETLDKFNKIILIANNDGVFDPRLSTILTNRIVGDLSLLLISPVLAIMVYFLLLQGGMNSVEDVWTLVVASFAAGLFTEKVLELIHGLLMSGSLLGKKSDKKKEIDEG